MIDMIDTTQESSTTGQTFIVEATVLDGRVAYYCGTGWTGQPQRATRFSSVADAVELLTITLATGGVRDVRLVATA